MEQIKIGIVGYGNLGRGVEIAVSENEDMVLSGVFTRRNTKEIKTVKASTRIYPLKELEKNFFKESIDVLIICGGSASDLPRQSPKFAEDYNIVDSFDNHEKMSEHVKAVDRTAVNGRKIAIIGAGWDPGLFSVSRVMADTLLPFGRQYTFWGRGVSQGHSDAIRSIEGVKDARQYTIPVEDVMEKVRDGAAEALDKRDRHVRKCFVVADEGADLDEIKRKILNMPNYFEGYETEVNFISEEDLLKKHGGMPHGGCVICTGTTDPKFQNKALCEFKLRVDSNPEFTGKILAAYARAAYRLSKRGEKGCRTIFDIALNEITPLPREEIIRKYL